MRDRRSRGYRNGHHIVDLACVEVGAYHHILMIQGWDSWHNRWHSFKNSRALEAIKSCNNCPVRRGASAGVPGSGGDDVVVIGLSG